MNLSNKLENFYHEAKQNRWFSYFAIFCRIMLALSFIPSGIVKIMGERFTALPNNHPLGHYLEALHHTGYYYTFIGVLQVSIALLLLVPRTSLLGALLYFPVIVNICVLTYAVRFEGTRIITFMVLANLYLLFWHYDRLKQIFAHLILNKTITQKKHINNKFPFVFFGAVFITLALVVVINQFLYNIRPGNSAIECTNSCKGSDNPKACEDFCDCIYTQGKPLDKCLADYKKAIGQ